MATLTHPDGRIQGVRSRHLIGRSRTMHTRFNVPEVSAQHAVIAWTGAHWSVRDLGSRNGTMVGTAPIASGVDVALKQGDVVSVGGETQSIELTSDEPPGPFATCGDVVALGEADLLALPSADDPVALVLFEDAQGWVLFEDDVETPVADGHHVHMSGTDWTLALPEAIAATVDLRMGPVGLADIGLDFRVSADEEYLEIDLRIGGETRSIQQRAHHYGLLTLARRRLADAEMTLPSGQHGWVYARDFQKMLRLTPNRVNLGFFRARRELEGFGIADAQGLIERRLSTQQVRLGIADVTVTRLE